MEKWFDVIALGFDALLFGLCSGSYVKYNYLTDLIKDTKSLIGVNPSYEELADKRPFVIYEGYVRAIGKPIRALHAQDVYGVVQRLTIKEHAHARSAPGSNHKNIIQEGYNVVPFVIEKGSSAVQVLDPLVAEGLELDTVYNKFENSSLGLLDNIWGMFTGLRQKGIETTEEMLKEGSFLTAIGEATKSPDGTITVGPSDRFPYYLSSMPVSSLIRKLDEKKTTYKWLALLFGSVGLVLTVIIVRKWWEAKLEEIRNNNIKKELKKRRQKTKNSDLTEIEICVVCRENPKEIIILPCGHVALCEECSCMVHDCPVCRGEIVTKAPAFIS